MPPNYSDKSPHPQSEESQMKAEFETVEVSPAMRDLIRRRTAWIEREFVSYERSLRHALATAYIAGMNDAIDVLSTSTGAK